MTPEEKTEIDERMAAFRKVLVGEDELGMMIRAHIYIEHEVENYIRKRLAKPEKLDFRKLEYFSKVKIAIAMGLDDRFSKSLKFIGEFRNRFAHELSTRISNEDAKHFYQALDDEERSMAVTRYKDSIAKLNTIGRPKDMGSLDPRDRCVLFFVVIWVALAVAASDENTH